MTETVLVTGATGTVGRALVQALRGRNRRIRATLGPNDGDAGIGDGSIEWVPFDFEDAATWPAALAGIDRLFLMRPPAIAAVGRRMGPFVAALPRDLQQVALLSIQGAGSNPWLPHRRLERLLERRGLPAVFLRPSFFMQNLATVHGAEIRQDHLIEAPAGDGAIAFVDAEDVADAAAEVLTEPGHAGRAYELTGPDAWRLEAVAAAMSEVLGRPIRYRHPSIGRFLRDQRARGSAWGPALVTALIYTHVRFGGAGRTAGDLERLLGRQPTTLPDYLQRHREVWAAG